MKDKLMKKIQDYHTTYMQALEVAYSNLGAMQAIQDLLADIEKEEAQNLNIESEDK
jgi:hypothetical protein